MSFVTIENTESIEDELNFQNAKFIFLCYSFKYFFNER